MSKKREVTAKGSKLQVSSSLRSAGLKDGAEVSAVLGGDDVTVKAHKFGWGFGSETIHLGTDSFFGGHLIFQALSLIFVTHLAEMVIYLIEYP